MTDQEEQTGDISLTTSQDNTIRGIAELVRAVLYKKTSALRRAEALVAGLGLDEDDEITVDAIEDQLSRTLGVGAMREFTEAWASEIADLPDGYGFQFSANQAEIAAMLWHLTGDDETAAAIFAALEARDHDRALGEEEGTL